MRRMVVAGVGLVVLAAIVISGVYCGGCAQLQQSHDNINTQLADDPNLLLVVSIAVDGAGYAGSFAAMKATTPAEWKVQGAIDTLTLVLDMVQYGEDFSTPQQVVSAIPPEYRPLINRAVTILNIYVKPDEQLTDIDKTLICSALNGAIAGAQAYMAATFPDADAGSGAVAESDTPGGEMKAVPEGFEWHCEDGICTMKAKE